MSGYDVGYLGDAWPGNLMTATAAAIDSVATLSANTQRVNLPNPQ